MLVKNGFPADLDVYAKACEKFGFPYDQHVHHHPTDSQFKENMITSAKKEGIILVTGCTEERKTDGETQENEKFIPVMEELVHGVIPALKGKEGEINAVFLSEKYGKALNPEILASLLNNTKWTMMPGGGVTTPGNLRPFSTVTFGPEDKEGNREIIISVNGGRWGNMQKFAKPITPEELGCTDLPSEILSMLISGKEFFVHFCKVAAAAKFSGLRHEKVSEEQCLQNFKDFCNPELTCKQQKEFGRKACLLPEYFRETEKRKVSEMTKALMDLVHAFIDPTFYDFIMELRKIKVEKVVERGIQGGVEEIFSGTFHDTTWGSGGGAQICIPAHALSDGSEAKGFFGKGTSLVFGAFNGDSEALKILGLRTAINKDNLRESCGIIFNKVWGCLVEVNSTLLAAKAKAQAEAKAKAQAEAMAKAQDEAMTEAGAA